MAKSIFIYGFHAILAQLDSNPQNIIRVYSLENRTDSRLNNLMTQLAQHAIKSVKTSKQQLAKYANTPTHQGIVAEILPATLPNQNALISYLSKFKKPILILILDSIQDPRNLGACLRSANAAGTDCVVINKNNSAPINALVHKTSAGALKQLKLFQVSNLSRTIRALQKQNIWVIGLDGSSKLSLYDSDLTASSAIVIGSEGTGLRQLTQQSCDQLVRIPMQGNVESLNLSVAASITLFEANRQRIV